MSQLETRTIDVDRLVEKLERIRFGLQFAEARIRDDNPVFADMLSDLAEEAEGALSMAGRSVLRIKAQPSKTA